MLWILHRRPHLDGAFFATSGRIPHFTFALALRTITHFPARFSRRSIQTDSPMASFPPVILFSVTLAWATATLPNTCTSSRHTVKKLPKSVVREIPRYVLWEPEVGDYLLPAGGRLVRVVPTATSSGRNLSMDSQKLAKIMTSPQSMLEYGLRAFIWQDLEAISGLRGIHGRAPIQTVSSPNIGYNTPLCAAEHPEASLSFSPSLHDPRARNKNRCGVAPNAKSMLSQGRLKLFHRKTPFRFLFNEKTRAQLSDAIFEAARGHTDEQT
jgi:hypothetical protein